MATALRVTEYRSAQQDVVALAQADLVQFWETLDLTDPIAASAALQAYLPELVQAYGFAAGSLAADYYDDLRLEANAPKLYRASVADVPESAQVQAVARWGIGPMFASDPSATAALSLLGGAVQRLVQKTGRDTIPHNVERDPADARWARSPRGKTCAWCLLLSSRGAVYRTEETATGYHSDCDCQPEPVWRDSPLSYDADALYEKYNAARHAAGSGDPRVITAQLRQDLGVA